LTDCIRFCALPTSISVASWSSSVPVHIAQTHYILNTELWKDGHRKNRRVHHCHSNPPRLINLHHLRRLPILVSMCRMSPTLRNGQVSQQYTGCHRSISTEAAEYYQVIIFTSILLFKFTTAGNTVVTLALVLSISVTPGCHFLLVIGVSLVHRVTVQQFSGHPHYLHGILLLKVSVNGN
jgi:hypothetical protein